jgi:hypothetical protein
MADIVDRTTDMTADAIGMGTPGDQIVAGLVLGVFIIISSSFSFGATVVLAPLAFAMVGLGVLRLVPQIDSLWPLN